MAYVTASARFSLGFDRASASVSLARSTSPGASTAAINRARLGWLDSTLSRRISHIAVAFVGASILLAPVRLAERRNVCGKAPVS